MMLDGNDLTIGAQVGRIYSQGILILLFSYMIRYISGKKIFSKTIGHYNYISSDATISKIQAGVPKMREQEICHGRSVYGW